MAKKVKKQKKSKSSIKFKFDRPLKALGKKVGGKINKKAADLLERAADKFGSTRAGEAWYSFNNWLAN